jgi:hypothetical protein
LPWERQGITRLLATAASECSDVPIPDLALIDRKIENHLLRYLRTRSS